MNGSVRIFSISPIVLTFFLVLLVSQSFAQTPKNFTRQPEKFLEEMEAFLALTNKKDAEELIERFEVYWSGSSFSNDQRERIYYTCDAMLKKRLKPFPDFNNYINSLTVFAQSGQSAKSFEAWHNAIDNLLTSSSRNFSSFLSVCNGLFQGGYIFESPSVKWRSSSMEYAFSQDSVPKIVFPKIDLIYYSKGDSARIVGTTGVFYPISKKFIGNGGRVLWERANLSKDQVYADLKKYELDVTASEFVADSALFFNKAVFPDPLLGEVRDKLL
ncbi:MAG: hypothetical protein ACO3O0_02260, partial [Bacteroidia bacterium]